MRMQLVHHVTFGPGFTKPEFSDMRRNDSTSAAADWQVKPGDMQQTEYKTGCEGNQDVMRHFYGLWEQREQHVETSSSKAECKNQLFFFL